jgi:hypothetical protein
VGPGGLPDNGSLPDGPAGREQELRVLFSVRLRGRAVVPARVVARGRQYRELHALANLVSLCPAHHWAVHEGGHLVWLEETGRLRFAGPDGRVLEPTPATGPATGDLVTTNQEITPDTIGPGWDGTPLDLDNAVLALLQPAFGEVRRAGRPAA